MRQSVRTSRIAIRSRHEVFKNIHISDAIFDRYVLYLFSFHRAFRRGISRPSRLRQNRTARIIFPPRTRTPRTDIRPIHSTGAEEVREVQDEGCGKAPGNHPGYRPTETSLLQQVDKEVDLGPFLVWIGRASPPHPPPAMLRKDRKMYALKYSLD